MLRRLLTRIQRRASWPVILGLLSAAGVLTLMMNGTDLTFSTSTIEDHSGGLRILDMRFSYGPEEANRLFEALGTEGRRAYLMLHLMPDMFFPISYALAFACTSAWFLVRLLPLDHPLQRLSLINRRNPTINERRRERPGVGSSHRCLPRLRQVSRPGKPSGHPNLHPRASKRPSS